MINSYIAVGSNIGDRQANIDKAIAYLKDSSGIEVKKMSTICETDPMGGPPQERYLNGVIEIQTDLGPFDLLKTLNKIEDRLGRVRKEKNGPRTIDLDILLYGDTRMNEEALTIPHPRMFERDFILHGLKEIVLSHATGR